MPAPRRRPRSGSPRSSVHVQFTAEERLVIAAAAGRVPGRPVSAARFVAEAALAAAGAPPPRPASGRAPTRLIVAEVMDAAVAVHRVGDRLDRLLAGPLTPEPETVHMALEQALDALRRLAAAAERASGRAA